MVSILNDGHWMWVFRAERSIIGLHTPERADCKSQETESIRLLLPLSSSFSSRLSEGPSFSLDSGKEPERLDEKEVEGCRRGGGAIFLRWGPCYPLDCSDFGPLHRKGGEPASYWRQRLDRNRRPGGVVPTPTQWRETVVRSEPGLVSPDLVPLSIC